MFYINYLTPLHIGSLIATHHVELSKILELFEASSRIRAYTVGTLCDNQIENWAVNSLKCHSDLFRNASLSKLVTVFPEQKSIMDRITEEQSKDEEGQKRFDAIRDTVSHLPLDKLEAVAAQSLHHLFEMTSYEPSEFQKANSIAFLRETLPDVEA